MDKFKKGDRVRLVSKEYGSSLSNPFWPEHKILGSVDTIDGKSTWIPVSWDNRYHNVYKEGLELAKDVETEKSLYTMPEKLKLPEDFYFRSPTAGILRYDEVGSVDWKKLTATKKPLMKTLNAMMKQLLDSDTQTLVKAGYINGDLEFTSEGINALTTILFAQNKPALVADAQTKLDAEKK